MNDRLKDGLAQLYGPLGQTHDRLREKMIAALPEAVPGLRPNYWRRIVHLLIGDATLTIPRRLFRLSPAVALVLAMIGLWLTGVAEPQLTFADVLEQISTFRPYAYSKTVEGRSSKPIEKRVMVWSLTKRREIYPNGAIVVYDVAIPKKLTLDPNKKRATEQMLNGPPTTNPDLLEIVRSMAGEVEEVANIDELGTRKIEGRTAKGFHRLGKFNDISVWADVQTKLPVRVEIVHVGRAGRLILTEFEFDVNFNESLFSVTAPEGYAVRRIGKDTLAELQKFMRSTTEQDLVDGLRTLAIFLDGEFPAKIELSELQGILRQYIEEKSLSEAESQDRLKPVSEKWTKAHWYTKQLKGEMKVTNFRYAGKGVKLGDADRAILWWCPASSNIYRVIYGDLSVKDVAGEDLPKIPTEPNGE